jgi:glucosylceramidase
MSARLWQTARGDGILAQQADVNFVADFDFVGPVVDLTSERGQTITGFGGAFTEAAASVFSKLSKEKQRRFLEGYFGPDGLGYTVGRVHINSCDFSESNYAFDDAEGDVELRHFDDSVAHDQKVLIPLIRAAQDMLASHGKELRLLATPWSPPAWMKTNHQMDHSDLPCMKDEFHDAWAHYISRWIAAYERQGVPIWAITVQNEPENDAVWEACRMRPEEEAHFLGEHLGPTLKKVFPELLIFAYDHNKDHLLHWARVIYSHPAAAKYADGIAFHWYSGDGFEAVQQVFEEFPRAKLLASEATYERYRWHEGTTLEEGDWSFGEGYAHDVIGDLNAGSTGWIDWNLLLDQTGGPNHEQNSCDAAVMADVSEAGTVDGGRLYRHPQFYFMGHFSKYILPGSQRLQTRISNRRAYNGATRWYGTCTGDDGLETTAVLRRDGLVAVVALNCGDNIIAFKLRDGTKAALAFIPPHSIQTYLLEGASAAASSASGAAESGKPATESPRALASGRRATRSDDLAGFYSAGISGGAGGGADGEATGESERASSA